MHGTWLTRETMPRTARADAAGTDATSDLRALARRSVTPAPDVRAGILTRRTFRAFERRAIPPAVRRAVLEAGRWAWTAGDGEPVRFIVLDAPALKRELFRLTRESKDISNHWEGLFRPAGLRGYVQHWGSTPFCVAVCLDPHAGTRHIHDTWNHQLAGAAATQNLALAARALGLALVMYTHFSQEKLKRLLDVPFAWDVMGVMGLGYPDLGRINPQVLATSVVRLPLGELAFAERYGRPAPAALVTEADPDVPMPDLMRTLLDLALPTRFTDAPVPPGHVAELLRAARWAPSAGNFQPVRYVVLQDRERLAALEALARESREISGHWFARYREGRGEHPDWAHVPLAIALVADPARGGPHIHGEATHVQAGGLAAQNVLVMAQALGLGGTLVTHWIEEKVKVLIDCPRTWDLVGVLPIGVPAERPARERKPLAELVYQDLFGRQEAP
jgi:nitroreductase